MIAWSVRRRPPVSAGSAGTIDARSSTPSTAELYDRYYDPLVGFAAKLTGGDRHWAEDVAQETLLRAWRRLDQLDHRAESLMPWLATVARRVVIDHRRMRQARPAEVGEAMVEASAADDATDALLQGVLVTDAMRSLSDPHREVLVETVLRDRSVNQAAEVLGVPVGTVKSRVYYASKALRVILQEMGVTTT